MTRHEIYEELEECRGIVMDEDTGEWAGNIAWRRVDELLDALNEINALGVEVD